MKIDRGKIKQLEELARIELTPNEVESIPEQLNRIIGFVEKIQSVDTSGVAATKRVSHTDHEHVRDDDVAAGLARDTVLEQAPDVTDGFFRVPCVIDRGEG